MKKRVLATLAIMLIMASSFFAQIGYVFADATPEEYEYISNRSELVAAVQSYLNSKGLGILCDVQGAIDEWMIGQQIELQDFAEHIEKTPAGILKFRFDSYAIGKLNSFIGDFVKKYNLADFSDDGQEQNELVYSGYTYVDNDGNRCLCYVYNGTPSQGYNKSTNWITAVGTNLKYSQYFFDSIVSATVISINYGNNKTYSDTYNRQSRNNIPYICTSSTPEYSVGSSPYVIGGISVIKSGTTGKLYFGGVGYFSTAQSLNPDTYTFIHVVQIIDDTSTPTNVTVHTPKGVDLPDEDPEDPEDPVVVTPTTRDGNTYNYDQSQTYIDNSITNNTTYYVTNPPASPTPPTQDIDPSGHIVPKDPADPDAGWDIDFTMPDWPNFDFKLPVDLTRKFPFCIPFDLLALFSLLDAEPEAPRFQGDIDLPLYTWHVDVDFRFLNSIMYNVRDVEKLGLIILLIVLTVKMFKT